MAAPGQRTLPSPLIGRRFSRPFLGLYSLGLCDPARALTGPRRAGRGPLPCYSLHTDRYNIRVTARDDRVALHVDKVAPAHLAVAIQIDKDVNRIRSPFVQYRAV